MKTRRRVRIVSGRSGLDSLRGDWQSLTDNWPEAPFYVLYDWYWAYLHYLEDDPAQVIFVVLEDASGCCGILPLRRERKQRFGVALDIWSVPICTGIDLVDVLLLPGKRLGDWWSEIGAALRGMEHPATSAGTASAARARRSAPNSADGRRSVHCAEVVIAFVIVFATVACSVLVAA